MQRLPQVRLHHPRPGDRACVWCALPFHVGSWTGSFHHAPGAILRRPSCAACFRGFSSRFFARCMRVPSTCMWGRCLAGRIPALRPAVCLCVAGVQVPSHMAHDHHLNTWLPTPYVTSPLLHWLGLFLALGRLANCYAEIEYAGWLPCMARCLTRRGGAHVCPLPPCAQRRPKT